jgi:hypothetical protein
VLKREAHLSDCSIDAVAASAHPKNYVSAVGCAEVRNASFEESKSKFNVLMYYRRYVLYTRLMRFLGRLKRLLLAAHPTDGDPFILEFENTQPLLC